MKLKTAERAFCRNYHNLKIKSGLHSPSVYELTQHFPYVKVKIDACFLCNPYAFNLFYEYFSTIDMKGALKNYPPNNLLVSELISQYRNLDKDRVIVGNGAMEIIETLFREVSGKRILIPIPTFSSYYELASRRNEIVFHQLDKKSSFGIEVEKLIWEIKMIRPDYLVIVNPSNPTGHMLTKDEIVAIHSSLQMEQFLIIDESFIDFAPELSSIESYAKDFVNLIIIRSLSKDFGIAGLRLGYAFLPGGLKRSLHKSGYLWNINGLAFEFVRFLGNKEFVDKYNTIKRDYRKTRDEFYNLLKSINEIKVYQSEGNFYLIETGIDPINLFTKLLLKYGIYIRILNDKKGLEGNFIRIACKDSYENISIANALKTELAI